MGTVSTPAAEWDELRFRADEFLTLRHLPGQHSQKSHGGGGGVGASFGMDKMSQEAYAKNYEVNDSSEFGGGPGGQGAVYSMTNGDVQIAFENEDGSTTVFQDLGWEEADAVAANIDWARGASPVLKSDLGDRGPDEDTGLIDWKASEGVLAGYDADGNIGLVTFGVDKSDVGAKFTLSNRDAGDLQQALDAQVEAARDAEDVE